MAQLDCRVLIDPDDQRRSSPSCAYSSPKCSMLSSQPKISTRSRQPRLPVPLGLLWPVERTNSLPSHYGQLRQNTDRARRSAGHSSRL